MKRLLKKGLKKAVAVLMSLALGAALIPMTLASTCELGSRSPESLLY